MIPVWLLKIAFHLLYYQMAWTYDFVAWCVSFGEWAAWRRLAMPFIQTGPLLELAYGTGGLHVDLLQAGYQPIGIDLSPYMARLAHQRTHRQGYPIRLSQAQAQQLPFPAEHFNTVIATFPTDYIFQPETLAEIERVLQPNGRLVVVMEGFLRGPWPLRPFIEWLYNITGQREFPLPQPNNPYFNAEWHIASHQGVSARLWVAEKQTAYGHFKPLQTQ